MQRHLHFDLTWPADAGVGSLVLEADSSPQRAHRVFLSEDFSADDSVGCRVRYSLSFFLNLELKADGLHAWCRDNADRLERLADLLVAGDDARRELEQATKEVEDLFYYAMLDDQFGFFPWS